MFRAFNFNQNDDNHNILIENNNINEEDKIFINSDDFSEKSDDKFLFLLNSSYASFIFDIIPKHFTITTNNNISHKFNIELLKDTSTLISDLLKESPDLLRYHINIDDEKDILGKFEKIYQGKSVSFEKDEILTVNTIISLLDIDRCPHVFKNAYEYINLNSTFRLDANKFKKYLEKEAPQTFTIITRKNKYKCNVFGICSSKILLNLVQKDPFINEYKYDFDDEFNEFQQISDLFNFEKIKITNANMYALKEMINDLQINAFIEKVETFIENAEKFTQTIDEQQTIIDSNEELFDWLYHIKERNVEAIKNLIVNSNWIKTEEKIQELVAFILQVINTDSNIHMYIIDLIIELKKESENGNCLNSLIPFLIQKLNILFGINLNVCSFVYKLYQIKIITKEELICMIKNTMKIQSKLGKYDFEKNKVKIMNLINWFYPEINENNEIKDHIGIEKTKEFANSFVNKYYNNNIEGYLKMRDKGEPDDELTIALRYDDIDTFQRIIIERGLLNLDSKINISNAEVPYNLYENYILNGFTNYINYACAYGSVKCFKYLLLNHSKIDFYSFSHAIYGGNIEIIKTVNQILQKESKTIFSPIPAYEPIIPSIIKHQNDVFDWIFQEKYLNKNINEISMKEIMICAAENGNAHALIEIIDNGFDFSSNVNEIFKEITKNGFYLMTKLFFNIFQKANGTNGDFLNFSYSTHFGNIFIFNESFNNMNHEYQLIEALKTAIHFKYMNIIEYFTQKLYNTKFKDYNGTVFACINDSISRKSDELFNYFVQQFQKSTPNIFVNFEMFNQLLTKACAKKNIKIAKKIIDMIIEYNHEKEDFTTPFYYALIRNEIEICKYFIENRLFINYEKLSEEITELSQINKETFSLIIESANNEEKCMFLNQSYLEQAITNKNIELIEYLFNSNIFSEMALFLAVISNDVDVVNVVLKYNSKPSFINSVSKDGTALCIAVENNNISIVKRLLSIPGINPSLYIVDKKTPLILAYDKIEILNEILDFYNKCDYITNIWQFNKVLKMILKFLQTANSLNNSNKRGSFLINKRFHILNNDDDKLDFIPILIRILEFKEIDPNCIAGNYTALLYACTKNRIDIVKILLNNEKTDVNLYSPENGNTPLMASIENDNFEITKLLIDNPKTNLNAKNFQGETALTLAVNKKMENVVELLINNERFNPDESNINNAFYISSGKISCLLSSVKTLDVNHQINKIDQSLDNIKQKDKSIFQFFIDRNEQIKKYICSTTLLDSVVKNDIEKVDLIINHQSFNKTKSQLNKSIFVTVECGNFEIFKKLIKIINDDVNLYDSNKISLLNFAVTKKRIEIVEYILDSQNFDPSKCDILEAFIFYIKNVTNESINIMNKIYNADKMKTIKFSELLPTGESFFTLIASQKFIESQFIYVNSSLVGEIATFLIQHGVDPNIPDKKGFYPLEYAILLESIDFVSILLNSNKINLNQEIEMKDIQNRVYENQLDGCLKASKAMKKTYLHIAARSRVLDILKLIVAIDVIDINAKDEFGETPLFEACRFNRFENIEYLVSLNTVDLNHCNNNGDDVLKISMILLDKKQDFEIKNREDYINALLLIFKRDQDHFDYNCVD